MKRSYIFIAIAFLLLPIVVRGLWFYSGVFRSTGAPDIPDFAEINTPLLPLSTPEEPASEVEETSDLEEVDQEKSQIADAHPLVLFDLAHDNQFQFAEIQALTHRILESGGEVETMSTAFSSVTLGERLREANAYVVIAPNQPFDSFDIQEIERFVMNGGRLLVVIDPTRRGYGSDYYSFGYAEPGSSLPVVNELLESFEVRFVDDYLYNILNNEGNFRNVFFQPADEHILVEEIEDIVFYATHSIQSTDGLPVLESVSGTRSSVTDQPDTYTPALLTSNDNLLMIGDLTFLTYPYNQVADNSQFIENISNYLISGERTWDLEDYPFFFGSSVELFTPEDFNLEADNLHLFESLQRSLAIYGKELLFSSDSEEINHHLRLSLLPGDEEVKDLLDPLGIVLPADSELDLLEIPSFGDLNPSGLGLIVLPPMDDGVELILIAQDTDGLGILVNMLSESSFYECLRDENIILCKVGESFDFGFNDELFFEDFGSGGFIEEDFPSETEEGGS